MADLRTLGRLKRDLRTSRKLKAGPGEYDTAVQKGAPEDLLASPYEYFL